MRGFSEDFYPIITTPIFCYIVADPTHPAWVDDLLEV